MAGEGTLTLMKFTNPPAVTRSLVPYAEARRALVQWSSVPALHSINEFGTVSSPGVSDLDILLIYKDAACHTDIAQFHAIPSIVKPFIDNGNIIVIPLSLAPLLGIIDKIALHKLSGSSFEPIKPSIEQSELIKIASCFDWLPERSARLHATLHSSHINISHSLCLLKSVSYSLQSIYSGSNAGLIHSLAELASLRDNWHGEPYAEKRLLHLSRSMLLLCCNALDHVSNIHCNTLSGLFVHPLLPPDHSFPLHHSAYLSFLSPTSKVTSTDHFQATGTLKIPGLIWSHFAAISSFDNDISTLIRRRIGLCHTDKSQILNTPYTRYLFTKTSLISQNLVFIKHLGLQRGLFRYGFYLNAI